VVTIHCDIDRREKRGGGEDVPWKLGT